MTYDPDFDISTSDRWWGLMSKATQYNLIVHIAKVKGKWGSDILVNVEEDGNVIYEDRGLEEDTAIYFRTERFIKEKLGREWL
jgi:hypothetical protein